MLDNVEFIIVDPALSAKPSANLSVAYWCRVSGGVCFIHGCWFGQGDPFDVAKYLFHLACPSDSNWGFARHLISKIYVEGEAVGSTVRKRITQDLAPAVKGWNIESIAISNEPNAKVRRIAHAFDVMKAGWIKMQLIHNPALQTFNDTAKRQLEAQLKAVKNNYKDSTGRDDFADLLGLTVELVFGTSAPSTAAPDPQPRGLITEQPWRWRDEEPRNEPDPDNGAGSGIVC